MGHIVGKDIYRRLGEKIDNLSMRSPWNEALHAILKELYTTEEADLLVKMPYGMATLERIAQVSGYDQVRLRTLLETMCAKGLVVDLWLQETYYYMPAPMVVGLFELTMMRTGENLDTKEWGRLFYAYLGGDDAFCAANFAHGTRHSFIRTLPHEEAIHPTAYVEILDYEQATALIEKADRFAIGLCSCRHEKLHADAKPCKTPLDTCSTFGIYADSLIRNKLAREVSRTEMLENLARSKELGLVLNADNVQRNISFLCHCCKCCCNVLQGITRYGYPDVLVTSNFIAEIDTSLCTGCGKCARACPVNAIEMLPIEQPTSKKKALPRIDTTICLGCGICALKCTPGGAHLVKREQRIIYPETTFERIMLQCLEKGTLQNYLFDDPQSVTHKALRGIIGGFLRLPSVKRALLSDTLRSTFLASLKKGATMQGKDWMTDL